MLLFLIGFPASGKSTLAQSLSRRSGLPYVDLDTEAERLLGCSIAEAFAAGRGDAFRRAERAALADVCNMDSAIVACGGGTPCYGDNMDIMLAAGTVACLTASTERILQRIEEAPGKRPMFAGLHGEALRRRVETLKAERQRYYMRASVTLDATYLDNAAEIEATTDKAIALLSGKLSPSTQTPCTHPHH